MGTSRDLPDGTTRPDEPRVDDADLMDIRDEMDPHFHRPEETYNSHRYQTTGGRNLLHDVPPEQTHTGAQLGPLFDHRAHIGRDSGLSSDFEVRPPPFRGEHRRRGSRTLYRPLPTPRLSSSDMSTAHSLSFHSAPSPEQPARSGFAGGSEMSSYEPRRVASTGGNVYPSPSMHPIAGPSTSSYFYSSPKSPHQAPPMGQWPSRPGETQNMGAGPSNSRGSYESSAQRNMSIPPGRLIDQPSRSPPRIDHARRSLSISPVKSTQQGPSPHFSGRSETREYDERRARDVRTVDGARERSRSPRRTYASVLPASSAEQALVSHTAEHNRPPAGAVASFFSRPPSRSNQKRLREADGALVSPPPTGPTSSSRHPEVPHTNVARRSISPVKPTNPTQAWFALGTPSSPRDLSAWAPEHIRSYDAGFEDAIRAVERGIIGIGPNQYRKPLLIRREIPTASVVPHGPQAGPSNEGGWRGHPRPLHTPLSGPLPHQPPTFARNPHSFHSAPLLPPNPHAVSPYDYHYSVHPSYPGGPVHDPHYDPYAYRNASQAGFYTNSHHRIPGNGGIPPQRSQRQLISCYPCRGRKLKCDGAKPCSQCVRRGSEADCAYASHVRRRGKGKKGGESGIDSSEPASPNEAMERGDGSGSSFGAVEVGRSAPISPLGEETYGDDQSPFDKSPFAPRGDAREEDDSPSGRLREVKEEPEDAIDVGSAGASVPISRRMVREPKPRFGGEDFYVGLGMDRREDLDGSDDV